MRRINFNLQLFTVGAESVKLP
ncbi:Protein of unknown function [Lactobacillus helveticus CIRM-BIA 101]|nr:Protein of unknown function [Lactobacillus helveticus CIRM-BIA 101]